ncbi:hypothetical protein Q9L58_010262 [Maublancomyces gigas]|uniref:Uncharacterized protein n=1 Tax=Discina gigas TaxID=1032678 RepID=A0ABR3G4N0_9PEZI
MVLVYIGKIDYAPYTVNTIITAVVPNSINNGEDCLIYWQWTKDAAGATNVNRPFNGKFVQRQPGVMECREQRTGTDPYYWFTWHTQTGVLQMLNENDDKCGKPIQLTLNHE